MIFSGLLDGDIRSVDVVYERRAARGCVDAEGGGVREKIEHAPAERETASQRAILPLVEKKPGFLARRRIDFETQSVFEDGRQRRAVADRLRLRRKLFEPARGQIVVQIDEARRELAAKNVE